ncbi:tetratricopeptide repeat protein [Desulfonatronospira sp.]|uniref:tetratricopeptide repeat protein n=1 Tax=Desulfonatronospira sp. TaxID=1962951 RepID=UPI0025BD5D0D|nr:tetratricopeptide repeat protein [Desulfonatronospira sp.]
MKTKHFFHTGLNWPYLFLIVLSGVVVYYNSFNVPFILDDVRQIAENPDLRSLGGFLSYDFLGQNRALVDLTFALNYHFGGLDVFGYHLINLSIHIINGILVYYLVFFAAGRLLASDSAEHTSSSLSVIQYTALFAALIFVVHPLQTQAVTYIVQRYTLLAASFYILSVLLYILGRNIQLSGGNNLISLSLLLLCFISGVMAFLSKQSAASLPVAILLIEFILYDRTWSGWKKKLCWIIPFAGLFCLFVLYNVGFFFGQREFGRLLEDVAVLMRTTPDISRWEYLVTQFCVIPKYLFMYLVPVGQNIDHMHPVITSIWNGCALKGLALIIFLLAGACFLFRKQPIFSLAIFWFFIALSVESSIIPIDDPMFEHRMYLPMIGPVLATAWAGGLMLQKYPRVVVGISLSVVIVLGFLSIERNKIWQSQIAIWEDSVAKNPDNYRAHTSLALALEYENQKQKAFSHYYRALELEPEYGFAHLNLGALLLEKGKIAQAEQHLHKAEQELPRHPRVLNNLGALFAIRQQFSEALEYFRKAVELNEYFSEARFNLALSLLKLEQPVKAREEIKRLLELDPEHSGADELLIIIEKYLQG